MKRNIIYLAGIALCAIGLFSGCDEDLPSYANLTVNAETLTINLDETTEGSFSIVEGNGGYKVNSSDATVATAVISGNEVIVTGLEYARDINCYRLDKEISKCENHCRSRTGTGNKNKFYYYVLWRIQNSRSIYRKRWI